MPGIFGLATQNAKKINIKLIAMQKAMKLYPHFLEDALYTNEHLAASRVHLGKIGEKSSPIQRANMYVWVEGEAYNLSEVAKEVGLSSITLGNLLLEAEEQGKLNQALNKLDGYFCAALYNQASNKVKLISDRYGMRVLYWYFKDGLFAWGSGVKAILAVESVDKALDQSSYDCFMDLGYLIGEHTWFEHIKLIKPATVLEFDINSNLVNQEYYWTWAEIKPSNLSYDGAVDILGELFIEAVARRFNPEEKTGISLSGGLDSRAIFAAIDHLYPEYNGHAFTFGIPNCDDILIAQECVNRTKNWQHHSLHFDNTNWFKPRFPRVWNTDGMKNLMHMHGSEFLSVLAEKCDAIIGGNLGDVVMRASRIERTPATHNKKIDEEHKQIFYKNHYPLTSEEQSFFDVSSCEPFLLMNDGRRFTNMGVVNSLVEIDYKYAFVDNKLLDFIFSLPDTYRLGNKIYSAMLQKFFPKFFKDIPWQNTRLNLDGSQSDFLPLHNGNQLYIDYIVLAKDKNVLDFFYENLNYEMSSYKSITKQDLKSDYLIPFISKGSKYYLEKSFRALTVELYLRMVASNINDL